MDIIAEQISDVADYRTYIRDITMKEGKLISIAKDEKAESVYETYYDYNESLSTVPGHRILAINRGEDLSTGRTHFKISGKTGADFGK